MNKDYYKYAIILIRVRNWYQQHFYGVFVRYLGSFQSKVFLSRILVNIRPVVFIPLPQLFIIGKTATLVPESAVWKTWTEHTWWWLMMMMMMMMMIMMMILHRIIYDRQRSFSLGPCTHMLFIILYYIIYNIILIMYYI